MSLAFIALISAEGFAQSDKQVQKAFESEIKKLDKAFDRKLEDLEDEYAEEYEKKKQAAIEKLKASLKKAMSEQDLDEAVRLRDLAKVVGEMKPSKKKPTNERQEALTAKFAGTSYEINFGGEKSMWTLEDNGLVLIDGEHVKYWFAIRDDAVICIDFGARKNTDILDIAKGTGRCELKFIGSETDPKVTHRGIIIDSK